MKHDLRLTIFWFVHLAMLGLFVVESAAVLSVWLKARVPGLAADASRYRKLRAVFRFAVKLVFSRRIWALLRSLFVDGVVHRRLYRLSPRRWLAHLLAFGSWLLLGVLSTMTGVVVEILPLLGMSPHAVAALPVIGHLFHADVWWVALVNELLGLVVVIAMILIIHRRYIRKDPQLRTMPADSVIIGLLAFIAISGFPTETFRLLADYTGPAGSFAPSPAVLPTDRFPEVLHSVWGPQWGFVGYLSAQVLGLLKFGQSVWQVLHQVFFWLHFVTVTALLYYLPFSRFFHVILGPVIVAYNTTAERGWRPVPRSASPTTSGPAV